MIEAEYVKQIDELEYKLSCVLDIATAGRISKPYTDMQHIRDAIQAAVNQEIKYAIEDELEYIGEKE